MTMLRYLMVVLLLAVSPLAHAVECVMAAPVVAQPTHPCEMMGVQPAAHASMTVADCFQLSAVPQPDGIVSLPAMGAVAVLSVWEVGRSFQQARAVLSPRPPPLRTARLLLLETGRMRL
ncbi:MAG: hypothetical protein WAZ18_02570 [Alphaproteobacteria bacterium]